MYLGWLAPFEIVSGLIPTCYHRPTFVVFVVCFVVISFLVYCAHCKLSSVTRWVPQVQAGSSVFKQVQVCVCVCVCVCAYNTIMVPKYRVHYSKAHRVLHVLQHDHPYEYVHVLQCCSIKNLMPTLFMPTIICLGCMCTEAKIYCCSQSHYKH